MFTDYGIDPEGPIPEEDNGTIVIPETLPPVSDDDIYTRLLITDTSFDDLGVQHYMDCKQHILNMI